MRKRNKQMVAGRIYRYTNWLILAKLGDFYKFIRCFFLAFKAEVITNISASSFFMVS